MIVTGLQIWHFLGALEEQSKLKQHVRQIFDHRQGNYFLQL